MTDTTYLPHRVPPRLTRWFESFPPVVGWQLVQDLQALHICESIEDGQYVVRAEVPGVDPDRDVRITAHDGLLTIEATWHEPAVQRIRSEFRHGTYARTVVLPAGADLDTVHTTCVNGLLTIRVSVGTGESPVHRIPIDT